MHHDSRRVAVVTGAGSGIGRLVSMALAAEGYTVVLAGRHADALRETEVAIGGSASDTLAVPTDVTDAASVNALFDAALADLGRVDVLFNNAGTFGPTAPVDAYPHDAWNAVVATNLTGAFLCAQRAFHAMRHQRPAGGRIINNGSLSASVPRPHAVAYTATKHAITGLTRALALEGRAHGIACGQIDVGNASTEMTRSLAQGALQPDGTRMAEPTFDAAEVARAVVYMATLPLDANVAAMTVMATGMPYLGRG